MNMKLVGAIAIGVVIIAILPLLARLGTVTGGLTSSEQVEVLGPGDSFTKGSIRVTFKSVAFGEPLGSERPQYVEYVVEATNISDSVLVPQPTEAQKRQRPNIPDTDLIRFEDETIFDIGDLWTTGSGDRFDWISGTWSQSNTKPLQPGQTLTWSSSKDYRFIDDYDSFISGRGSALISPTERYPFRIAFTSDQIQVKY